MSIDQRLGPIVGLGAVSLALLTAGCGGTGTATTPGLLPGSSSALSRLVTPMKAPACNPVTNRWKFNSTPIQAGSWIWFTSVMTATGPNNPLSLYMADSYIKFSAGGQNYVIKALKSHVLLNGNNILHLQVPQNSFWNLAAPYGTSGNNFLDAIGYQVPTNLPGGIKYVSWSATFHEQQGNHIMWRWGATVYTNFTTSYAKLHVKPLDDSEYAPYNSDPAGTPESYKQYVIAGGTGSGGTDYTGSLTPPTIVTPCI